MVSDRVNNTDKSKEESLVKDSESQLTKGNHETKKLIFQIFSLSIPAVLSSFLVFSIETINLLFAAHLDTDDNSDISTQDLIDAIGMGNTYMNFCGFLFGIGMLSSLDILCSQAFGTEIKHNSSILNEREELNGNNGSNSNQNHSTSHLNNNQNSFYKYSSLSFYFISLYFILVAAVSYFAQDVVILLGQDEDVARISASYVHYLLPGLLIQFYINIVTKILNSKQIYFPVFFVNLICICIHPLWCYLFLDVLKFYQIGLSLAYNTTSLLMFLIILFYSIWKKHLYFVSIKIFSKEEIMYFLKISFQSGVLCSMDILGFELISIFAAYLPQDQLDANICIVNIYNNIYSISLGFSSAVTMLVGNYMGENKPEIAKKVSKLAVGMILTLEAVISALCVIFHTDIAMMYISDSSILQYTSPLMKIVGFFILLDAIQLQLAGIIRGIGRQTIAMIISMCIFIVMQSSLCYLFAFAFDLGVYGLWYAQICSVVTAGAVFFIILYKTNWEKIAFEINQKERQEEADIEKNKIISRKGSNGMGDQTTFENSLELNKK
jgi:MATE family multidrug resistance protein